MIIASGRIIICPVNTQNVKMRMYFISESSDCAIPHQRWHTFCFSVENDNVFQGKVY